MSDYSARAFPKVVVCLAGLFLGAILVVRGQTVVLPGTPPQLKVIRTIEPKSLRESDLDRLSGGLPQKVPFRMATDARENVDHGTLFVADSSVRVSPG